MARLRLVLALAGLLLLVAAAPARAAGPSCAPAAYGATAGETLEIALDCSPAVVSATVTGFRSERSTLTIRGDGRIDYLAPQTAGLDRFVAAVTLAGGATRTLTVEIGVDGTSRASCGAPGRLELRPNRILDGRLACRDSTGPVAGHAIVTPPASGGQVDLGPDGSFLFTAGNGEADTHFTFTAGSGTLKSAETRQDVAVFEAANNAPRCNAGPSYTARPGGRRRITLACSDPDGDLLDIRLSPTTGGGRLGTVSQPPTGDATVLYTAPNADDTEDTFSFSAWDGKLASTAVPVTVSITSSAPNQTPICDDTTIRLRRGAETDVTVPCFDEEGDPLTFELVRRRSVVVTGPTGADQPTFHVSLPQDATAANAGFDFTVGDGTTTSTATVTVLVDGPARPVCNEESARILRSGRFASVALDTLCRGATSFEVDRAGAAFGRVVSVSGAGVVGFQAATDAPDGATASFSFTARNDAGGVSDPVVVRFTTGPSANQSPRCEAVGAFDVRVGAIRTARLRCSDADGDALTATLADRPDHGSATLTGLALRYDAPAALDPLPATDTFTIEVTDPLGGREVVTVPAVVRPLSYNTTPTCAAVVPARPRIGETRPIELHCTDAEGDAITDVSVVGAGGGDVGRFEPRADDPGVWVAPFTAGTQSGDAYVDYRPRDREFGATARASFTVLDKAVNSAPRCPALQLAAVAGQPLTIDLARACTDADGDTLLVSVAVSPEHGVATAGADNRVTYVADAAFVGSDVLTLALDDQHGATTTAMVAVDVAAAPREPDPEPGVQQPAGGGVPPAEPGPSPAQPAVQPPAPSGGPAHAGTAVADERAPKIGIRLRAAKLRKVVKRGLPLTVSCDEACTTAITVALPGKLAKRLGLARSARKPAVVVRTAGTGALRLRFSSRLARTRSVQLTVTVVATDAAGNRATRTQQVTLRR